MKNERAFPSTGYGPLGMTLRDYFAGQVLCGIFSDPEAVGFISKAAKRSRVKPDTFTARTAYQMADAMLAEREKTL